MTNFYCLNTKLDDIKDDINKMGIYCIYLRDSLKEIEDVLKRKVSHRQLTDEINLDNIISFFKEKVERNRYHDPEKTFELLKEKEKRII